MSDAPNPYRPRPDDPVPDPQRAAYRASLLAAADYLRSAFERPSWATTAAERAMRALYRALNAPPDSRPETLPAAPPSAAPEAERASFTAAVLSIACASDSDAVPIRHHLAAIAGRRHFDP